MHSCESVVYGAEWKCSLGCGGFALDAIPITVLLLLLVAGTLASHELGYRFGRFRRLCTAHEHDAHVGGIVTAELGLLAFLLAFTYGIAANRHDERRQSLLNESNAIGTSYLRAAMLPPAIRERVRDLLREYTDVRIAAAQNRDIEKALRRSEDIHRDLWAQTVAAAEADARSIPTGLFIASVNDIIDLHAKRVTATIRSRIPPGIWFVLFVVAMFSFAAMGYHGGLTARNRSPLVVLVALTFSAVLMLVVDLDRPGEGVLRISQQPLIELRASMVEPQP